MKHILRRHYPVSYKGEDIYLFILTNGDSEVRITNYGAIITSFRLKNTDGSVNDIVLGFDKIEDYWADEYLGHHPWFGAAVGRYANRIKNAKFILDGKEFHLSRNRGNDQLHGGFEGFDRKLWEVKGYGDDPHPFLDLRYVSKDGEEGYPGTLDTILRYELNEKNELTWTFTAHTDKPTPVNLTQHSYFNLNNGEGTIHDHLVKIYAARILEQAENLVVTGETREVNDTAFDLREFMSLSEGLNKLPEYDKSFVLDKGTTKEPVLAAELRSESSGLLLQVLTTEPLVHFYSGKWIPPVSGKYGLNYGPFSGLCLETHVHPNAVNIPSFPNTILRPGESYRQQTIYKLVREK